MTVVVTAVFHPKPGKQQELAEAMRRGIAAVHTEDGCELYAIHDAEDGTITMIEKWSSAEALDAHGDGDEVKILREDVADPRGHGAAGSALTSARAPRCADQPRAEPWPRIAGCPRPRSLPRARRRRPAVTAPACPGARCCATSCWCWSC